MPRRQSSSSSAITESSILTSYLLTPSSLPTILPYSTFQSSLFPSSARSNPDIRRLYRDLQFQRNIDIDTVRQNIDRECKRSTALKARLARSIRAEMGAGDRVERGVRLETKKGKKRKRGADYSLDHNQSDDDDDDDDDSASTTSPSLSPIPSPDHNPNVSIDHQMDTALFGASGFTEFYSRRRIQYRSGQLLHDLSSATTALESEISLLDSQAQDLLSQLQETVGALSDLRYGKFARLVGSTGNETRNTLEESVVQGLKELTQVCGGERSRNEQTANTDY